MNIFFLDIDPVMSAQALGDKHIVKMPLETAQILSTVWHRFGSEPETLTHIYKATHESHPCTKWVATNKSTYQWTFQLFVALCDEFSFRRGKAHGSSRLNDYLRVVPEGLSEGDFFAPPLCMPDEFKVNQPKTQLLNGVTIEPTVVCQSYKNYYQHKFNAGIAQYHWGRSEPAWINTATKSRLNPA